MQRRLGEESQPWFRSDRYYHTNDGWWSMTRENQELGPFNSQNDAQRKLDNYINHVCEHATKPQ